MRVPFQFQCCRSRKIRIYRQYETRGWTSQPAWANFPYLSRSSTHRLARSFKNHQTERSNDLPPTNQLGPNTARFDLTHPKGQNQTIQAAFWTYD